MTRKTLQSLSPALEGIPRVCARGLPQVNLLSARIPRQGRFTFQPLLRCVGGTPDSPDLYEWVLGMFDEASTALEQIWWHDEHGDLRVDEPDVMEIARPGALMTRPS